MPVSPNALPTCRNQKNEFMSKSGTCTSCLAVFKRLPRPAFLATKSPSLTVSSLVTSLGSLGDGWRVGGAVKGSISITIEDLRRMACSNACSLRVVVGLGGAMCCVGSWVTRDGRSNDQDLTRSNARAWQPATKGMNMISGDVKSEKKIAKLTHPSENACHL